MTTSSEELTFVSLGGATFPLDAVLIETSLESGISSWRTCLRRTPFIVSARLLRRAGMAERCRGRVVISYAAEDPTCRAPTWCRRTRTRRLRGMMAMADVPRPSGG